MSMLEGNEAEGIGCGIEFKPPFSIGRPEIYTKIFI